MNIGLGDNTGSINFCIPKSYGTAGDATYKPKAGVEYAVKVVEVKKLDQVLQGTDYVEEAFALWIDVEGFQKKVLVGSDKVLRSDNCKLIKIEVKEEELFVDQGWFTQDVICKLNSLGYQLVFRDFEYGKQYNLLFIKYYAMGGVEACLKSFFERIKPISFKDICRQCYRNVMYGIGFKEIIIMFLGKRRGHEIAAFFGSKSSKSWLKMK